MYARQRILPPARDADHDVGHTVRVVQDAS